MKHGKRSFAVALGLCMLLGALTPAALAGSACPHGHENCGYQAAEEGQPCSVEAAHIHDAACGYAGIDPDNAERNNSVTISLAINFIGSVKSGHVLASGIVHEILHDVRR